MSSALHDWRSGRSEPAQVESASIIALLVGREGQLVSLPLGLRRALDWAVVRDTLTPSRAF